MAEVTWTVLAEAKGYFVVGGVRKSNFPQPPHYALRKIEIKPNLDEQRRETGSFKLEVDFIIGSAAPDDEVANLGRNLLDGVLDMVAFSTGYSCVLTKTPSVRRLGEAKGSYRHLIFAEPFPIGPFGSGMIGPPPVLNEGILGRSLTPEQQMLLGWYRASLGTQDYVESCWALLTALEPLSNHFPCPETRIETCGECGAERVLAASMAQRVRYFLTTVGSLDTDQARAIWDLRNEIAHGRMSRTSEERQRLASLRHTLMTAVVNGLRAVLGVEYGGIPGPEPTWSFSDAMLAVEYTIPEISDN